MTKVAKFDLSNNPELLIDGFDCKLRSGSDFWRIHLDYCESGRNNDLGVYFHQQKERLAASDFEASVRRDFSYI